MTPNERKLLLMMARLLVWMINAKSHYALHPDVDNLEQAIIDVEYQDQ